MGRFVKRWGVKALAAVAASAEPTAGKTKLGHGEDLPDSSAAERVV